ncbi:hypothetical protein EES41_03585 [Streptomyces sp. ADI95-16]|uniref:hypothetical protein n=1 Tax=Streptomyces sp. ADI95-16 TaxID=1522758 RepID=UPI000F3A8745|nr:hypothetical protein [Streptomyces sp. ADI95-16]AYV25816.1 hypothetical protein EES41_03585 [Streptomyces sp. ADI95-16]
MNHSANISHEAVLRARVALLGSEVLPLRQQVAAYRLLAQVSPLVYLPLLAQALWEYNPHEFAHRPEIGLALRAESVAAARRMHAVEPGWAGLLVTSLVHYEEQLALMGRTTEAGAVAEEVARLRSDHGPAAGR